MQESCVSNEHHHVHLAHMDHDGPNHVTCARVILTQVRLWSDQRRASLSYLGELTKAAPASLHSPAGVPGQFLYSRSPVVFTI